MKSLSIFSIIVSIVVFSILVIVHEFGHFILAKKNGILVEEFAVGMGPILISKKFGETLYSVRAFPLGGFCRMLGEDDSCDDKRAFNSKGVWRRISVIFAGPFMNFLFAFIILFWLISTSGFIEPVIDSLSDGYSAKQVGMEVGDRITKINGQKVHVYQDFELTMQGIDPEKNLEIEVDRNGEKLNFSVKPLYSDDSNAYIVGFRPAVKKGPFAEGMEGYEKATILETAKNSFDMMNFYVRSVVVGFVRIFSFRVSPDEIAGPIGIVKVVGEGYEQGLKISFMSAIKNVASLAALLSANLGVLNLFPIPAMDGGRLLFLILEAIRKRPINQEIEGRIHFAGFVLLMAFMVLIAYNDISKIFLR